MNMNDIKNIPRLNDIRVYPKVNDILSRNAIGVRSLDMAPLTATQHRDV